MQFAVLSYSLIDGIYKYVHNNDAELNVVIKILFFSRFQPVVFRLFNTMYTMQYYGFVMFFIGENIYDETYEREKRFLTSEMEEKEIQIPYLGDDREGNWEGV